jgi:hypothetical protein
VRRRAIGQAGPPPELRLKFLRPPSLRLLGQFAGEASDLGERSGDESPEFMRGGGRERLSGLQRAAHPPHQPVNGPR